MKIGKPTDNLDDKADSKSGYVPWAPVTDVSTTWHTKSPFFQDLLSDADRLSKFMNLDGFCDQMRELLQYSSDTCSCLTETDWLSDDEKADEELERKYCPEGRMKLDHRFVAVRGCLWVKWILTVLPGSLSCLSNGSRRWTKL